MKQLFGYKEAYFGTLFGAGLLALCVTPFFWLAWFLFLLAFFARP